MSMHEDDLALARMDDDGHGCAITIPPATVWVSVTSHRARNRMRCVVRNPGRSSGIRNPWPPRGEYYEVPARFASRLRTIAGLRVLRGTPGNGADLFEYWAFQETGGPEPGNWPVPR